MGSSWCGWQGERKENWYGIGCDIKWKVKVHTLQWWRRRMNFTLMCLVGETWCIISLLSFSTLQTAEKIFSCTNFQTHLKSFFIPFMWHELLAKCYCWKNVFHRWARAPLFPLALRGIYGTTLAEIAELLVQTSYSSFICMQRSSLGEVSLYI